MVNEVKLIDGGFVTQLTTRITEKIDGHPLYGAQYLFTNKKEVIETHRDFVRAGCDVIMTNTYQASIPAFQTYLGLTEEESHDLIQNAVNFAKQAIAIEKKRGTIDADKKVQVAGSVGPFGASLRDGSEFTGDYVNKMDARHLREWHYQKIKTLVEAGVDILALETIPALAEADILVRILREFPNQKAWISFSCKDEGHIANGENVSEGAVQCWLGNPTQVIGVGANCGAPSTLTKIIKSIRSLNKSVPLVIYPNSGESWDPVNKMWFGKNEREPISSFVDRWLEIGVSYVGGCCRTYAADMQKFRTIIDAWESKK